MQITDVRVFPVRDDKLKAFVSVVFESCFMVNDIKVINGRDGYFISMPSRRKKNGEFKDIAHPLNTDTRRLLEARILDEYEQVVAIDDPPARRYEKADSGDKGSKPQRQCRQESNDEPAAESSSEPELAAAPAAVVAEPAADDNEQRAASSQQESSDDGSPGKADERGVEEGPAADQESRDQADSSRQRRDLDEVVEDHLSDSFWS